MLQHGTVTGIPAEELYVCQLNMNKGQDMLLSQLFCTPETIKLLGAATTVDAALAIWSRDVFHSHSLSNGVK